MNKEEIVQSGTDNAVRKQAIGSGRSEAMKQAGETARSVYKDSNHEERKFLVKAFAGVAAFAAAVFGITKLK